MTRTSHLARRTFGRRHNVVIHLSGSAASETGEIRFETFVFPEQRCQCHFASTISGFARDTCLPASIASAAERRGGPFR
jgi:hypothetical protein